MFAATMSSAGQEANLESRPTLASTLFAGRYVLEREIGRGATATVHLAHDTVAGTAVAIKLLRPELAESIGAERFLREVRLTQRLQHAHIARVIDSGEAEGRLFYVLPYMEGGTLRERMVREKQLPIDDAVQIGRIIAGALDYAHREGVIHRDVKPENILFSGGEACLADFGVARAFEKAIDESTTSTGLIRGTPAYMSPEQASGGRDYDGRSDIYSLACVIYEMLTGMPAFIGPTPEAIIAQRFAHRPRDIRVYRPAVSPALEAVIAKALELSPADRYSSGVVFAEAMSAAARQPPPSGAAARGTRRRVVVAAAVIATAVVALGSWIATDWRARASAMASADTTSVALLALDGDDSSVVRRANELLRDGLSHWRGVSVADLYTGTNRHGPAAGAQLPEAAAAAIKVGAGRFVRGRITLDGTAWRLHAALYDARTQTALSEATAVLPRSFAGAASSLRAIADSLLLRGIPFAEATSPVLAAVQSYAAGRRALANWRLTLADSLFSAALGLDRDFSAASLWLAQLRSWRLDPTTSWQPAAERTIGDSTLSPYEQELSRALVLMAHGEYAAACEVYNALEARNARDVAAWYGLGQCRHRDRVVVPDERSPSGWRFRSSYHQAMLAYARALELSLAGNQTCESDVVRRMGQLLFTNRPLLRSGSAMKPDTTTFLAYPTWRGDSLAFVPYRRSVFAAGGVRVDGAQKEAAMVHTRELFGRIARSWASSVPSCAGAKEAVARYLEMSGDPAAIDTLEAARMLASGDASYAVRLAAEAVFVRIEFDLQGILNDAISAKALADSVLAAHQTARGADAATLAALAAVTGRCRLAGTFAGKATTASDAALYDVPLFVKSAVDSVTMLSALGCQSASDTTAMARIMAGVQAASSGAQQRVLREYALLGRAVSMIFPLDSALIARLADRSGDYLLRAEQAATRHDTATVRSILVRQRQIRGPSEEAVVSPDALYSETRLWMSVGDTATARAWLYPTLSRVGWLATGLEDPINVAALARCFQLGADLASAHGDIERSRRWARTLSLLWRNADPALQPVAARMSRLAQ